MDNDGMDTIRAELREAANALMMLRAEMNQREARMSASFNQQVQLLQQVAEKVRSDIAGIVDNASTQIAQEARKAVAPVAAHYDSAVSATSARLRGANKAVWMWFAATGAILLLVLAVAWAVLGYYRHQLDASKAELQRYEDAVPVVQAFYASDVMLCDGRICANADSNGRRFGDKRQYRQARPRPQK